MKDPKQKIYLVGAGPGDPELLTLKAYRLLQEAEIIVYDRLVSRGILDIIGKNTEKIFAGKSAKNVCISQNRINNLLLKYAKTGKKVVRLKGGDPLIFGRVSEEVRFLANNGIESEIIPGISAASGCCSATKIPLTHRDIANSVIYITGHSKDNKELDINWKKIANSNITIVIYMGLNPIAKISSELIKAGLSDVTPTAAIENGTLPEERVLYTNLKELPNAIENNNFKTPTLIIIGKIVELGERNE